MDYRYFPMERGILHSWHNWRGRILYSAWKFLAFIYYSIQDVFSSACCHLSLTSIYHC